MRFLVALIACLMAITPIGAGSAARAADPGCMDVLALATTAGQDIRSTKPTDCDRNCPHHGLCHEHQVAATADAEMAPRSRRASNTPAGAAVARLVPVDLEGSLRPPRA